MSSGRPCIPVMKPAEHRESDHLAHGWRLDNARKRSVVIQRPVAARRVVITDILAKDVTQVSLAENYHMVKTFTPDLP